MHSKKRPLKFLFLSIFSFIALALLVYYQPPEKQLSLFNFQFSMLLFFFGTLFLFLFSTSTYIFRSTIHGTLIALIVIVYLVFRLNNLTHPFFVVMLLALFLVLELLFTYRK